jgi:tripartite-type tricarboxylate transporter receptor subunit TctC
LSICTIASCSRFIGAEIRYNSPEEFQALIQAELTKWAKVIRAAGIRVDER